ncbi:hypothetical protein IU433_14720 [Nocardia puris]|uniref:hypothetical protein n=1 Tax=Nocardia puris TaxID=208602 RepID=UPI00189317F2|nr:hypothetical protein [Nocardia puris]MBF6460292.1 hypothetical protein [Nocardia puris]
MTLAYDPLTTAYVLRYMDDPTVTAAVQRLDTAVRRTYWPLRHRDGYRTHGIERRWYIAPWAVEDVAEELRRSDLDVRVEDRTTP